jgi:hypothetical protein
VGVIVYKWYLNTIDMSEANLPPTGKMPPGKRYRNITERTKSLLFLLREIPYATFRDIRRIFFPLNKSRSYCIEMVGVLVTNNLVAKYMIGNGVNIYYLNSNSLRILEFYMQEEPKFHSTTASFYYSQPPRKPSEISPFFFFPAKNVAYRSFTPHYMHLHPYNHTIGLLELYVLFRKAFRFLYVLWLDQVESKKTTLSIPFNPDLLLSNDPFTESGRIYVEFENSAIGVRALVEKLDNTTSMPADWFLILCSSDSIFQNFGRTVRKVLLGEARSHQRTLFFAPRTQAVLSRNLLIGIWRPSSQNKGIIHELKAIELFRYDDAVFDKTIWANQVENGVQVLDPLQKIPLKKTVTVPYPARKPGRRKWLLPEILDPYSDAFKAAVRKAMWKGPSSIE